jgi:hypothetical protein
MTKVLILFRKRADLTMDEFQRYWNETHGPIAATFADMDSIRVVMAEEVTIV